MLIAIGISIAFSRVLGVVCVLSISCFFIDNYAKGKSGRLEEDFITTKQQQKWLSRLSRTCTFHLLVHAKFSCSL